MSSAGRCGFESTIVVERSELKTFSLLRRGAPLSWTFLRCSSWDTFRECLAALLALWPKVGVDRPLMVGTDHSQSSILYTSRQMLRRYAMRRI